MAEEPPAKRQKLNKPRKIEKQKPVKPGSPDVVLQFAIQDLLGSDVVQRLADHGSDRDAPYERFTEHEVEIKAMSSHGDGLAVSESGSWVVVVPFSLPGERVLARVHRHERLHSHADLVKVIREAPEGQRIRDDSLVRCPYFGKCSGCQYQQIPYSRQLEIKQSVVERAFAHAADLPAASVPSIQPTLPSPLQYGYRTKLTPHFNPPSGKNGEPSLAIGFEEKGRKRVLDIEKCPIATAEVNDGLTRERKRVQDTISTFKRGATVLLRHAWPPTSESTAAAYCETDHKAVVRERVGDSQFEFTAGSFFQNNNSILPALVDYVVEQLDQLPTSSNERFLVDAYCGSGLFGISLASRFSLVKGVEISSESVRFAKHNAELNNVRNATFIEGKAEAIFASIDLPGQDTTVLIDPPRKGCDELFLSQLVAFGPAHIVYVSCNVHSQAPDVAYLVNKGGYAIRSIRGVDLFPQTHHVESVCVLTRAENVSVEAAPRDTHGPPG